MSDYKTQEQVEFAELFAKLKELGINGVDVARELQTTAQTVSYYNTGQRNPRPLTMDKLRAYVKKVCGEAPGENEIDHWKSRAEVAEKQLADLRELLQKLGTAPEQKEPLKSISAQAPEEPQVVIDDIFGVKKREEEYRENHSPETKVSSSRISESKPKPVPGRNVAPKGIDDLAHKPKAY